MCLFCQRKSISVYVRMLSIVTNIIVERCDKLLNEIFQFYCLILVLMVLLYMQLYVFRHQTVSIVSCRSIFVNGIGVWLMWCCKIEALILYPFSIFLPIFFCFHIIFFELAEEKKRADFIFSEPIKMGEREIFLSWQIEAIRLFLFVLVYCFVI